MQYMSLVAVFFIIWWLSFVTVLPIGSRSHHETGSELVSGGDPGAPVLPRLGFKMLLATGIAIVVTALLFWGMSNETLHHYWNR